MKIKRCKNMINIRSRIIKGSVIITMEKMIMTSTGTTKTMETMEVMTMGIW